MKKLLIILIVLISYSAANAQTFQLFDIDTTGFPVMKAKFYAFGADGKQLSNFNTSDFEISEDGVSRKVLSVSCPQFEEPKALSSVLTIDVSGSMTGVGLQNAKIASTAWVNGLPLGKSECAITTFSDDSYIIQDFTTNKNKLLNAINVLNAMNGTDYDAAYWKSMVSGLEIAKTGKYKKVLVFISDGLPNFEPQTQKIIDLAKEYKVEVYCVTLNLPSPQCLKDIASQTGGQWYENVTSENEARSVYQSILNIAQNVTPCTIEWESEAQCPKYSINLSAYLKTINIKFNSYFILPFYAKAYLDLKPSGMTLLNVPPGTSKDTTIVIKANNRDFNISDITLTNPNFSISPKLFILKANESKTLTVTYTPIDSSMNFCSFNFENDLCKARFYARGGFRGYKAVKSTFKLTHPNGGEKFGVGTDTIITWEGCGIDEKVKLEYSIDSGKTYKLIASEATRLKYAWNNIPNTPSNQCLIKASLKLESDIKIFGLGTLNKVIYSPDGSTIASCGGGGIFIWDAAIGDTILSIRENTGVVKCIAFTSDGNIIASGSTDGKIRLWDSRTGVLLNTLTGHKASVSCISCSPNGNKIVSGSQDHMIRIWDANTGALISTKSGDKHGINVSSVNFSPDGSKIVSCGEWPEINIWDANTGELIKTIPEDQNLPQAFNACFSPDGSKICGGSKDGRFLFWEVKTGIKVKTLTTRNNLVCFTFSLDWTQIACGYAGYTDIDHIVLLFDADNGAYKNKMVAFTNNVHSVSFTPDGKNLVSGSYDNTIKILEIMTDSLQTLTWHKPSVLNIKNSPDGKYIASSNTDNNITIWDINSGEVVKTLSGITSNKKSISYSPGGKIIAATAKSGSIIFLDIATGLQVKTIVGHNGEISDINFNKVGNKIISGCSKEIKIWDANTGESIKIISDVFDYIYCVNFSPDESQVVCGGYGCSSEIFDSNSGEMIRFLYAHCHVNSISYNPDGSKIVTCSEDNNIKIWGANTGYELKKFMGHTDIVNDVRFSPNGIQLASGSKDNTVKIWDVATGIEIKTLKGHNDEVTSVSYNPDGFTLASGSRDGTIRIWDMGGAYSLEDVSDSLFAIIAPQSITRNVDMGKLLVGSVKDSVVQSFILNSSEVKSRIDSIKIVGSDADQFDVASGRPPYILDANQSRNVEFRFKPSSVGVKNAEIYVYSAMNPVITKITGEGVQPQFQAMVKILDFGEVEVGSEKVFKDTVLLKNISDSPISISNTVLMYPDIEQFQIQSGGGSFTLNPNEERQLTMQFKPKYGGRTSGRLGFEYNGVGSPAIVGLFGTGIGGLVYVQSDSAYPGETRNINLMIEKVKPEGMQAMAKTFSATLKFQSSILVPRDRSIIKGYSNDSTIVNIMGPVPNSYTLLSIPMIAALGSVPVTDMEISDFKFFDNNGVNIEYDVEVRYGSFKILGICKEGGYRLINPTGKIAINAIRPNPADSEVEIELELIEVSGYKIILINSLGQNVKEINKNASQNGKTTEKIDISNLSPGIYNLILQTESEMMSERLLIVR